MTSPLAHVTRLAILSFALWATATGASAGQQQPAQRSISNIRGNVYRVDSGGDVSVFLLTPEGIILVDPLNRETAIWLKAELATRFPGQLVRYVVPTHPQAERAAAASVSTPTAQAIGNVRFNEDPNKTVRELPAPSRAPY